MASIDTPHRAVGAMLLGLSVSGCVDQLIVDRFVSDVRSGSAAADTVHDFDLARAALQGNLGQFEILYRLSPDNDDALFLLTRGWAQVGSIFLLDDAEQALARGDLALSAYEVERVRSAMARARFFARAYLSGRDEDFGVALRRPAALRKWLREHFDDASEAPELLWSGVAWAPHLPHGVTGESDAAVGFELVARALELDETVEHGYGHVLAGLYFANPARWDPGQARSHLTRAVELSGGRLLAARSGLAAVEQCVAPSEKRYAAALRAVLDAGDVLPAARVANLAAVRAARRRLANPALRNECRSSVTLEETPGSAGNPAKAG